MTFIPPTSVAVLLVLLSIIGLVVVLACIDFLRPPGQRPRVDHPPVPPLKGLARAARAVTNPSQPAESHR